jgi:hypothetical protein
MLVMETVVRVASTQWISQIKLPVVWHLTKLKTVTKKKINIRELEGSVLMAAWGWQ